LKALLARLGPDLNNNQASGAMSAPGEGRIGCACFRTGGMIHDGMHASSRIPPCRAAAR
jgi:hypothetical protein